MTVSSLLAHLAVSDIADDTLLDNVWSLAERSSDLELLVTMLERSPSVTDRIRTAAVARKEAEVRIAYLGRTDTPSDERARLLENERRSEVFAGLLTVAKENADLGARLAEQLAEKPTKVLARVVLREDFDVKDSAWVALRTVSSDKKMSRPLESKVLRAVARFSEDEASCAEMVEFLPDLALVAIAPNVVPEGARARYLERLVGIASAQTDRWDWEVRHRASTAAGKILELAQLTDLDDATVIALGEASKQKGFETAEPVAAVLAGRLALVDSGDDAQRRRGLEATGADIDRLVELALAGSSADIDQVLQGLLENPAVRGHEKFESLVRHARPAVLVRAMSASRSADLLVALWPIRHHEMPDECWNFVDDRDGVIARMVTEMVARLEETDSYRWGSSELLDLLELGVSTAVVASLPFRAFVSSAHHYYRWSRPRIIEIVGKQVLELQKEFLGSDPQLWENFNNLSTSWTGTLGDLLDASRSL